MAMRYCKDCEFYECCKRSPLGGCQELDNIAPKPAEPIATKETWKQLYEQLDWDWEKFRREATKDFVAAMLSNATPTAEQWATPDIVNAAIEIADALIKQLKESEK